MGQNIPDWIHIPTYYGSEPLHYVFLKLRYYATGMLDYFACCAPERFVPPECFIGNRQELKYFLACEHPGCCYLLNRKFRIWWVVPTGLAIYINYKVELSYHVGGGRSFLFMLSLF